MPEFPSCSNFGVIGIYCLLNPYLEVAKWLSIVILAVVASGWRPRYKALFH
jgi:hypothetical protein